MPRMLFELNTMVSIDAMPNEILHEILKEALDASYYFKNDFFPTRDPFSDARLAPPHTLPTTEPSAYIIPVSYIIPEFYTIPDPRRGTLFAFTMAQVCTRWRDITSTWSDAWDHVVFDLQEDPTPFNEVFAWSGEHPISVYIFNSVINTSPTIEMEMLEVKRVQTIMGHLYPHLGRCRSLRIKTMNPISLPSPLYLFAGSKSTNLESLALEADIPGRQVACYGPYPKLDFPLPALIRLSLSGAAIMHTAWEYPGWVDVVPQLDHLKVATFSFMDQRPKSNANKPDKDTLELFISTISRIKATHLHLHNLSLSYDTPEKDIPRTYHLDPANMNLHNVSGPFLYEFVRWMDRHEIVGKVRISDSIMSPQPTIPVPIAGESLELYNIPTSASMVAILGMFNTSILQVSACPGFDDAVVRWLTQKDAVPGLSGKNFAMDTMERLEIVESINFGSYDMRRLVQTRARAADERIQADPTSNGVVPIEYLLVSGDCPVLSVSDMDWYRKNSDIVEVSWIREWDGGNKMEIFDNFDDLDDYSDD